MAYTDQNSVRRADSAFIRRLMKTPLLERENEFELARRWREGGDAAALQGLVKAYGRLVVAAANKFRHYGLPIGDLVQEGHVGLLQAAQRFDPDRDVRFSTYAGWWIKAAMQDYVLRNWSIVRTGTTAAHKTLFFNLQRLRRTLDPMMNTLTEQARDYIAEQLNVTADEVDYMDRRMVGGDISLNMPVRAEAEQEAQDFLPDDAPTPETQVMLAFDHRVHRTWLRQAMQQLDRREQHVIQHRKLREEAVTLEDLGQELGVSKERVRQLETRAMDKLRSEFARWAARA